MKHEFVAHARSETSIATTATTNVRKTRRPEDKDQITHEQHAADTSQCGIYSPQPNPWPTGPSVFELGAAVQPKVVSCRKPIDDAI